MEYYIDIARCFGTLTVGSKLKQYLPCQSSFEPILVHVSQNEFVFIVGYAAESNSWSAYRSVTWCTQNIFNIKCILSLYLDQNFALNPF